MTPVKDQGYREACSMFAATGFVEALAKKRFPNHNVCLSEQAYLALSGEDSGDCHARACWVARELIWKSDQYPYNPDPNHTSYNSWKDMANSLPKLSSREHKKFNNDPNGNRIDQYQYEDKELYSHQMLHIMKWMSDHRLPCLMTINTWRGPEWSSGKIDKMPPLSINRDKMGRHAILLTGYDVKKKIFMFKNSWGTAWGNEGYGTITFDVLARTMSTKRVVWIYVPPKDEGSRYYYRESVPERRE